MHYSIDAFVEETAAMMFNYSWQIETIKKQNPKMNFAITPVPQFNPGNPVNIANYWGYTVSKNKMEIGMGANGQQQYVPISQAKNDARIHEAWQFLKFLTFKNNGSVRLTNAISKNFKDFPVSIDPALEYAKKTNKPAARYDIIEMQKADALLFPFVSGNLIAKSWYNVDADASENVLSEMIDSVVRGDSNTLDALKLATERVNNLNIRK
jgi:ABC-type glycerol-3-phosphate transport system substrate-binding protein